MTVATAAADESRREAAGAHLVDAVAARLGGRRPDLCFLFASAQLGDELAEAAAVICERLSPRVLLGTTAESVVWDSLELEQQAALVLWAAHLPGVRCAAFHLSEEDVERLSTPAAWHEYIGVSAAQQPHFVVLVDPYTVNPIRVLERLGEAYPGRPAVGGLASGGKGPGQNVILFEGHPLRHGLCGVALWGNIEIDTVVSQGCRPIGRHLVITEGERNVIRTLGGKPSLAALIETLKSCTTRDLELAQTGGLLVGRVINEQQPTFVRGDFLIRYPLGFDENSGAMMINDLIRKGQTIQFHVRDSASADDDLISLLAARPRTDAAGALLFTCNGRGSRLFAERHHDARAIARASCGRPLAGFFCLGEIGPVGHRNFVHGHTAVVAFFRPADVA